MSLEGYSYYGEELLELGGRKATETMFSEDPTLVDLDIDSVEITRDGHSWQMSIPEGLEPASSLQMGTNPYQNFSSLPSKASPIDYTSGSSVQKSPIANQQEKCEGDEDCLQVGSLYCNDCDTLFCGKCWARCPPHRRNPPPGGKRHEPTDRNLVKTLNSAFRPQVHPDDQLRLHEEDQQTAWFGVLALKNRTIFQDFGRFTAIAAGFRTYSDLSPIRYPRLVSFVGETGAGKSSLIKALIDIHPQATGVHYPTPVVASAQCDEITPTSGDVHLFCDPRTYQSEYPILFADCEGLKGGNRVPQGSRTAKRERLLEGADRMLRSAKLNSQGSGSQNVIRKRQFRLHQRTDKEIIWADDDQKRSRAYVVQEFYPRILSTFSDVIVFVLRNPRTIEDAIAKLLEWASVSVETSSNRPVSPCAIVAMNGLQQDRDENSWKVDFYTASIIRSIDNGFTENATFKPYLDFWRTRGRNITRISDLILQYYSSFRVVPIPLNDRPKLVVDQLNELYEQIKSATTISQNHKKQRRMLLDTDAMHMYLQSAFGHFTQTLTKPFDFVAAALANCPVPPDFGNNIVQLMEDVVEICIPRYSIYTAQDILEFLAAFIGSCVYLDATRNNLQASPERIYQEYRMFCRYSYDQFIEKCWPCEFTHPRDSKIRCISRQFSHGVSHQSASGKYFRPGSYVTSLSDGYRAEFESLIEQRIKHFYDQVGVISEQQKGEPDSSIMAHLHSSQTLRSFYSRVGGSRKYTSHRFCFCCLNGLAEHWLDCGHIICTPCLQSYGFQSALRNTRIYIERCPLDGMGFKVPPHFDLKPLSAGTRVLSLDGGGIRGIMELEILSHLENKIGYGLSILDFFDLIIGTGCGGLIALGLGTQGWSVQHCKKKFNELYKLAFTPRKGAQIQLIGALVTVHHNSQYETQPFENGLQDAFGDNGFLFGGSRSKSLPGKKVAVVTTTSTGKPTLLANYNRSIPVQGETSTYNFQRPRNRLTELKTWEAIRATTAAPVCFKPFIHQATGNHYLDGGLCCNNPIKIAESERKLIWEESKDCVPDIVLSLGSGFNPNRQPVKKRKKPLPHQGPTNWLKLLRSVADDHVESSQDCERTWTKFASSISSSQESKERYFRMNVQLNGENDPPSLDNTSADVRNHLIWSARKYLAAEADLTRQIADRLICSVFYFEVLHSEICDIEALQKRYTGEIRCRFENGSDEIKNLGKLLSSLKSDRNVHGKWNPYFQVWENGQTDESETFDISPAVSLSMELNGVFSLGQIEIVLSSNAAIVEIVLHLDQSKSYPISGFPRALDKDMDRLNRLPRRLRLQGRTGSMKSRSSVNILSDTSSFSDASSFSPTTEGESLPELE